MSATNRGTERRPYDFYATPINVVENLLNNIDLNQYGDKVLEQVLVMETYVELLKVIIQTKVLQH